MNLATAFAESVGRQPQKTALFWGNRAYSYAEVGHNARWVASHLREKFGVKAGARVGLWLKNCPEFVPAFFGILEAGGVVVPINNFLKNDEVSYVLSDAGIDLLITDHELGTHHRALEHSRPQLKLLRIEDFESQHGHVPDVTPQPSSFPTGPRRGGADLAAIIYTSGTTGHPKGAMLSHNNLLHNVESCRIVLKTVNADRFGVLLPLFHSYMMTVGMLLPLLVGGSMVVVKSLHPVRNVLQELLEHGATVLPAIPQFYRSIINAPAEVRLPFRICVSGAAPLPVQVLREFEARFKIPLIEGYGLSEASPVVAKNPIDGTRKAGSIGIPVINVEVSIQDDNGQILDCGEVGELCVRGGNVMLGYWNNPVETAKVMRGDWLLTGDIGYKDTEGYFFITERKKDMLLVNGINVYPREIEEALYQFPGVKEAAVIGRPDPRKGEQPVAFVTPADGTVLEEKPLQHFLRRKLADYKVPRKYVFLPVLPRNATGKILKTVLRGMTEI
jgi:long-chain acyl-CoA synthetase